MFKIPTRKVLLLAVVCGLFGVGVVVDAAPDAKFFNGKDLNGWRGNPGYWSVEDGAIVGTATNNVPRNEFIWSDVEVKDFYLQVDVKLTPNARNAGIQFRSKKINAHGQAKGYQADAGAGVWGKLYHEHGRGKLDWNHRAPAVVKPGEWNRYEILAVGNRIWTAINGTLCVAYRDAMVDPLGYIALQIHSGPPQTVRYRGLKLVHNPKVALIGLTEAELDAALPPAPAKPRPKIKLRSETAATSPTKASEATNWPARIAAVDPGSKDHAWAQPSHHDEQWKTMKLPGHFENAGLPAFDGVVWFRKSLTLSAAQAKTPATLHLGQIDDMDVTWVNGVRVGGYEIPGHHYTVRRYPIPDNLLREGENVIAVRVMDHGWPGGIAGAADQLALALGDERVSLANTWRFAPGAPLAKLIAGVEKEVVAPAATPAPFDGVFSLQENEVVAWMGGSTMVKQVASGALEALLTQAAGERPVYFRDLSWQADTVYQQQRPRNFGTQAEMLNRVNATMVIASFGQMEVLDGVGRLPEFIAAYESLLAELAPQTERLVLITPFPFTRVSDEPFLPDLTRHNAAVVDYSEAIVSLAKRKGWVAVDLSRFDSTGCAEDGYQLTPKGHRKWAAAVARQLLGEPAAIPPPDVATLVAQIQHKNEMWRRHWRPTNWAFLYGNRTTQPSSHDHRPGKPRWFPIEIDGIVSELEAAEDRIFALRKEAK